MNLVHQMISLHPSPRISALHQRNKPPHVFFLETGNALFLLFFFSFFLWMAAGSSAFFQWAPAPNEPPLPLLYTQLSPPSVYSWKAKQIKRKSESNLLWFGWDFVGRLEIRCCKCVGGSVGRWDVVMHRGRGGSGSNRRWSRLGGRMRADWNLDERKQGMREIRSRKIADAGEGLMRVRKKSWEAQMVMDDAWDPGVARWKTEMEGADAVETGCWEASRALGYGVTRGRRKLGSALNGRKMRALIAGSGWGVVGDQNTDPLRAFGSSRMMKLDP